LTELFKRSALTQRPQNNQGNRNNWRNQPRQYPAPGNRPQYNSTTAPRSHNNTEVPMDTSRARTDRCGWVRGRVTQTEERPTRGPCFTCGQQGHFKRNCPNRQQARAATSYDQDGWRFEGEPESTEATQDSKVSMAA
jgi:hypothetical protein